MDDAENESNEQGELKQSEFMKESERDLSCDMEISSNNEHTTAEKTLENEDEAPVLNGLSAEVNNLNNDNSEGAVEQNNSSDSETDTAVFNKDKRRQSSDHENKRLENANVNSNKLRIVDSDSEDEEIFSRLSKKEAVRDELETSDSEEESESRKQSRNTRVINKFFDSDSNDSTGIVNSIEEPASNKVVSQMKSRFQSLIDSESEEDDQEGRQDEKPLSPVIGDKKTKRHKNESSKTEKKKLSTRASKEEAMKQIKSETQRLIRESKISLPYHRPKQRTLQEFLSRKKVMSVLPKAPTMAAKLKMSSAIVDEMLKEKEKEAEVFYKSSDSEEEKEGDVLNVNEEGTNSVCPQEAKKDNVSRKLFAEDNSTASENDEEKNSTNAMDVTLIEPVEPNRENINEEKVSGERMSEVLEDDASSTLTRANNLIASESSKEADGTSAMDITLTELDKIEDDQKIIHDEVDMSDLATIEKRSKLESIAGTIDLVQKDTTDDETAVVIGTDKLSSENLNKDSASTSKVSEDYANMIKLSLGEDTDESDDYGEYGLPPPKFDDSPNINQNKTLLNMKPKLRGDPGTLIDLTSDVRPSKKGVDDLIDRFVHKHSKANERVKEISVTTIQVKDSPNGISIVKEKLPYRLPNAVEEDPKLNKPGAKLVRLKEELKHKMALKRDEEWKLREQEMKEQEIEWNESINEEDSFAEVYSPSTESHRSEEEEPIEDDVCMGKEKKKKSAFIDYEAEVSEDDIENDTDEIEDEDENDEQEEKIGSDDENEDEDSDTNEQNKTFKRIVVPLEEDSRSSTVENDKDKREDNLFPRTTSLDMFRRNSNENETSNSNSEVSKTVQTPQTKPNSFSLVSPATQLTALNMYVKEEETPKKGKQTGDEFDSIKRLIDIQDDVLDEDLVGLCSGNFPASKVGLNFAKETNVSDSQLLELCSGKFSSQPNDTDLVDGLNEAAQSTQISEEKSGKKEERAEGETPRYKFRVLSSDEEEAAEEIERSKKKKVKQLNLSDDEEGGGSVASSEDEEVEEDVEEDVDDEKFIDYDSDENEIIVPKKNIKEYAATFLEEEAELSESDGGEVSADEDEQELDKFEVEDGDDEDIDEARVRDQVGKLHMKQLLDEDQREVKMLQDLLFEDGDLYSETGRERKFKWRNIDKQDDNNDLQPLEEKDGLLDVSDNEEEVNWRKMRYEREKFLAEKKASVDNDNEDILNNQVFKVGMKIVKKRRIDETRTEDTLIEPFDSTVDSRMPRTIAEMINASKFGDKSHMIHTAMKKHSFLARGEKSLERLASLAKQRSAPLPSLKRKNFVFAHVDLDTENTEKS